MPETEIVQHPEARRADATGAAVTRIGGRAEQQDAFAHGPGLWAVADGMGGHAGGAEAAGAALDALTAALDGPCDPDGLVRAFAAANDAVRALADGRGGAAPGTTLVALVPAPGRRALLGAWIGDSRAYLVSPAAHGPVRLRRLTTDHETASGALTACLGDHGPAAFRVDTFTVPVGAGFRGLLCTDGAFGDDDDGALAARLGAGLDTVAAVAALPRADNVTAVLVDVDRFATS
jgi:serine/threonine protein phosphatase PrpC